MKVKVTNKSDNPIPQYKTDGAAGVDLSANLGFAKIIIPPLGRRLIPTGLSMEIPQGYEGQIRARSGLALKYGLTVLNSPGTIDSDYRGEIKVLIVNISNQEAEIEHGERIAQMVFAKVGKAEFVEADILGETQRGSGGFGSTGK
jgi:dUTP pyrophosphatase